MHNRLNNDAANIKQWFRFVKANRKQKFITKQKTNG